MPDVTQMLSTIEAGDSRAAGDLLPLVYEELRKLAAVRMAGEQSGATLQATALVHEAWLRLVGPEQQTWQHQGHFFGAAAVGAAIPCCLAPTAWSSPCSARY